MIVIINIKYHKYKSPHFIPAIERDSQFILAAAVPVETFTLLVLAARTVPGLVKQGTHPAGHQQVGHDAQINSQEVHGD